MTAEAETGVGWLQAMEAGKEAGKFPLELSEAARPCSHLILRFLVSGTVRRLISVVLSHPVLHSDSPRRLTHPPDSLPRWDCHSQSPEC